jgi:hypothetical protein
MMPLSTASKISKQCRERPSFACSKISQAYRMIRMNCCGQVNVEIQKMEFKVRG